MNTEYTPFFAQIKQASISKIVDGLPHDYTSYNLSIQLTSTIYNQKNKNKGVLNKVLNTILEATSK